MNYILTVRTVKAFTEENSYNCLHSDRSTRKPPLYSTVFTQKAPEAYFCDIIYGSFVVLITGKSQAVDSLS